MPGEPLIIPSIIPAWCRAVVSDDTVVADPDDTPVRVALVTPNSPGAWIDTDLATAESLNERLRIDLAEIRKVAERG